MRQYLSKFSKTCASTRQQLFASEQLREGENHPGDGKLLEKGDIYRQIASMSSDFTCVFARTGALEHCTISEDMFHGLHIDDLLASGFVERLHVTERPAFLAALDLVSHEGKQTRLELRLRCPSTDNNPDHFCWIEISCSPLAPDEDVLSKDRAALSRVLCVGRDISDRKQREDELIALEQTARELVESKSRALANMSHAVRTPLNAIIGFSQMMQRSGIEAGREQKMQEYAGIIHDSGRDLLGVVDEIRDMSQIDAGRYRLDPQIFRIADLVAAAVELVQVEAEERGVRLAIAAHNETLEISTDLRICKQALAETLALAIKAAPAGAQEKVTLSVMGHADQIEFVVTFSDPDDQDAFNLPGTQSQLHAFIDLLSGQLYARQNAAGQNEVIVKWPSGLVARTRIDNIVAIDAQSSKVRAPLKKSTEDRVCA